MIPYVLCMAVLTMDMPRAKYSCKYMDVVLESSEKFNIPPELLISMIKEESGWWPNTRSRAGACGLTQVMPKYSKYSCAQLKDPKTSIREGAKKLSYWVHDYGVGDYKIGLCGYNGGYVCKRASGAKRSKMYADRIIRYTEKLSIEIKKRLDYEDLIKNLDIPMSPRPDASPTR